MNKRVREESPFKAYHLVVRAHRREMIFKRDEVREHFFHDSMSAFKKNEVDVLEYTLMDNHAHFFVMGELEDIPSVFRSIGATFCRWFNRENGFTGAVFDSRYYLSPIKSESQFVNCLAYIANNPVRAGIVSRAEQYPYSSFRNLFKPFCKYTNHKLLYEWIKPGKLVEIVRGMVKPEDTSLDPLTPVKPTDFDVKSKIASMFDDFDGTNFEILGEDKQQKIVIHLIQAHANAYQISRVTRLKYGRVQKFIKNYCETN